MDDNIKDVKFEDVKEDKTIRGKALYFSTSQVANILEQPDSKIRYYTTVFDDILKIEFSNKQRRYTEQDIDKLRFIIELKNEGMTLKQIHEYCQNVDFNEDTGIQIKESNPLSVQTLAKALLEEQNKQLVEFKETLLDEIENRLNSQLENINVQTNKMSDKIREDVAITVDEVVSEKLDINLTNIKTHINESTEKSIEIQQENKKKLDEVSEVVITLKEENDEIKELLKDAVNKQRKSRERKLGGFIDRILGKDE